MPVAYFFMVVCFCRPGKVKLYVEQIDGLADGIIHMIVAEPREVVQVVVAEVMLKLHCPPIGKLYMLVHQPLLAHPLTVAEHPQQFHRVYPSPHSFAHEYVAAIEDNTTYIIGQCGQFLL